MTIFREGIPCWRRPSGSQAMRNPQPGICNRAGKFFFSARLCRPHVAVRRLYSSCGCAHNKGWRETAAFSRQPSIFRAVIPSAKKLHVHILPAFSSFSIFWISDISAGSHCTEYSSSLVSHLASSASLSSNSPRRTSAQKQSMDKWKAG